MNRLLHALARDWEKAILGSSIVVGLCLALWWFRTPSDEGLAPQSTALRARPTMLGPGAWAFLADDPHTGTSTSLDSLFQFSYKQEATGTWADPPKQPPVEPPVKKPSVTETPVTETSVESPVTETPPKPSQKQVLTVHYLGIYVGTTGKRLAAVEIHDSKTGGTKAGFWDLGPVSDGIRLEAFDGNALRFLAPDGGSSTVARGAKTSVQLH